MGSKLLVMDANDIVKMLTSYSEGRVPLDAELNHVAVDSILKRQIAFIMTSQQWPEEELLENGKGYGPLQIRYEGKRMMTWGKKGTEVFWSDTDAPKFQK